MSAATRREAGLTLLEVVVTLAVLGAFTLLVAGMLTLLVRTSRAHAGRIQTRVSARAALALIAADVAQAGSRIPRGAALYAPATLDGVTDTRLADAGTDTLCLLRSRTGNRTPVLGAPSGTAGTLRVRYHTGDPGICPDAATCGRAFAVDFGGEGDLVLVMRGTQYWVCQITGPPSATLGPSGYVSVPFSRAGLPDNTGGAAIPAGETTYLTGLVVRTYRVKNVRLEVSERFPDPNNPDAGFAPLADGVEDLQVAYVLADGTRTNSGPPAQIESIRGIQVSLVAAAPEDSRLGDAIYRRPALENHAAGTTRDRRRRLVLRQLAWARNLDQNRD